MSFVAHNARCDFFPERIVYMSCDPASQARDAKVLVKNGYAIKSVQPIDQFPQTRHIECLVVFEKKQGWDTLHEVRN